MPLAGPRPNPSPAQLNLSPTPDATRHASTSVLPDPPFPTTPTSSEMPFPHQSSLVSGTTVLEPTPRPHDTLSAAEGIRREWTASRYFDGTPSHQENREMLGPEHEADIASRATIPYDDHRGGTSAVYDSRPDRAMNGSPSIGPWDSASQRSLPVYPSLGRTRIPMSNDDPRLGGGTDNYLRNKPSYAGGLSYIDEEGLYYKSQGQRPASDVDVEMRGLVGDAADMGRMEDDPYRVKLHDYEEGPYPYPPSTKSSSIHHRGWVYEWLLFPTGLDRVLALFGVEAGREPIEQAIERKRRGMGAQRWPVAAWALTVAMTSVLVYELVANYRAMGTPIQIHPSFNYMIGPSSEVLINIGARFPPCTKYVQALPPSFELACLNDTSNPPTTACSIEQICGHGGFPGGTPDQHWRFVLPIFLHVGIIHLVLNMVAQVLAAAQVEREMGTVPFLIVYFAGGIYGFVLGGNFTRTGIPSVGASGALFATAFLLFCEFVVGFAIGYIPNAVDGLAHLGGWAMGILTGIVLYPSISETKRHRYIIWACRLLAIPLIVMAFVLTIRNFYTADPNAACEWCKYLSCIPTSSNDHCSGTGITTTTVTHTRRFWDSL